MLVDAGLYDLRGLRELVVSHHLVVASMHELVGSHHEQIVVEVGLNFGVAYRFELFQSQTLDFLFGRIVERSESAADVGHELDLEAVVLMPVYAVAKLLFLVLDSSTGFAWNCCGGSTSFGTSSSNGLK